MNMLCIHLYCIFIFELPSSPLFHNLGIEIHPKFHLMQIYDACEAHFITKHFPPLELHPSTVEISVRCGNLQDVIYFQANESIENESREENSLKHTKTL